ncbi:hypothetical protein WJX74_009660 [Apatococcus lobatus]|uniref:Uncharacterized protein n=1 Tax=Apatococcus lobatus TaxID=904363 RepID=A0AAW1SHJ4_9CHLO
MDGPLGSHKQKTVEDPELMDGVCSVTRSEAGEDGMGATTAPGTCSQADGCFRGLHREAADVYVHDRGGGEMNNTEEAVRAATAVGSQDEADARHTPKGL